MRLFVAIVASMQIFHIPYWLDGSLGHHYVFETILAGSLIGGCVLAATIAARWQVGAILFAGWVAALLIGQAALAFVDGIPYAPKCLAGQGVETVTYYRPVYATFEHAVERELGRDERALILVESTAEHMHVEFTRCRPPFEDRVLVGRIRRDKYPLSRIRDLFPTRSLYLYRTESGTLRRVE